MAKNRTVVNLSPSFIKVMPFKCAGSNLITLESYTNSFHIAKEGLVCIFQAEANNTEAVKVQLSKFEKQIKLLDSDKRELPANFIKAGRFYHATYNGTDLILHNEDIDLEAGANINLQKKPNGTLVISSINTDTWRGIGDNLDKEDSKTSASLKAVKLLNDKIKALEIIINENKNIYDKFVSSTGAKLNEIDKKIGDNATGISNINKEIGNIKISLTELGNGSFVKVTKKSHGFKNGDVLYYDGSQWILADLSNIKDLKQGKAICVVNDANSFYALVSGIREIKGDILDYENKPLIAGEYYFITESSKGKLTRICGKKASQPAAHLFVEGNKKYIEVLLTNGITVVSEDEDNGQCSKIEVEYPNHPFKDGDALAYNGSSWELADISNEKKLKQVKGVCIVNDANRIEIFLGGVVKIKDRIVDEDGKPLMPGEFYFLSVKNKGKLTRNPMPSNLSQVVLHCIFNKTDKYAEFLFNQGVEKVDDKKDDKEQIGSSLKVTQANHQFKDGDALFYDGKTWELADIKDEKNLKQVKGICLVNNSNEFTVYINGIIETKGRIKDENSNSLSAGEFYFLSQTAGKITKTPKPSKVSQVVLQCLINNGIEYVEFLFHKGVDINRSLDEYTKNEVDSIFVKKTSVESNYAKKSDVPTNETLEKVFAKKTEIPTNDGLANVFAKKIDVDKTYLKKNDLNIPKIREGLVTDTYLKSKIVDDLITGGSDTLATGNCVKQLKQMMDNLTVDKTAKPTVQGNHQKLETIYTVLKANAKTFLIPRGFCYAPEIYIDGERIPKSLYDFETQTGLITFKTSWSEDTDLTINDEIPSYISYFFDSEFQLKNDSKKIAVLKENDVVVCLGTNAKFDGGFSTRVITKANGPDCIPVGNLFAKLIKSKEVQDFSKNCKYEIGDIYITASTTNPATKWVGTVWKKHEGRFICGTAGNETSNSLGGNNSTKLTVEHIPLHTHNITGTTTSSAGEHSHTVDNHTHTQPSHAHRLHQQWYGGGYINADNTDWVANGQCDAQWHKKWTSNPIENSGGENTGGATPKTNSVGGHTHTFNANISQTGAGKKFSIIPQYIKFHIWERIK